MYYISKAFHFTAGHRMPQLPEGHPDRRQHGHDYLVVLTLRAEQLDEYGFVFDVGELRQFKQMLDEELDHSNLHEILPGPPSTEYLAKWLFDRAKGLWPNYVYSVRVRETPKIWAEYREEGDG
jgi:6-pyruvoyltetrahydropterin/6-carboxytetrahydropterin synthase